MSHSDKPNFIQLARRTQWASFVCFAVFMANVVLGKSSLVFGWKLKFLLDGTPEFLLLLISVTLFMISALLRERDRKNNNCAENTQS